MRYTLSRKNYLPEKSTPWVTRGRKAIPMYRDAPIAGRSTGPNPERSSKERPAGLPKVSIMRYTLLLIALVVVISGDVNPARAETPQDYFPKIQSPLLLVLDQADPRDNTNQPVASSSAREELQSIFQAGLYTLLLQSDIHSIAEACNQLKIKLNLAAQYLFHALPDIVKALALALPPLSRKFLERFLTLLAGLFVFQQLITAVPILTHLDRCTARRMAPTILRC